MIIINNKFEFIEKVQSNTPIVIIFHKPFCASCKKYFGELSKYDTKNFYLVDIYSNEEDTHYYVHEVKMRMAMPDTRVYKNGECLFTKVGILYETQMKELYDFIDIQ